MTQDDNAVETEIFDFDKMVSVLEQARRGLRSDVQLLVDGLDELAVLVPLAKSMSDIPVGVTQELGEEVTLSPHLLPDPEGNWHVALFSDPDALRTVGEHLDWNTSDGELEFCTLPLRVGLELALQLMEDHKVQSVVFNPGDPTELMMSRDEIAAIASGKAVPLVGYVQELPPETGDELVRAELSEGAPEVLLKAINQVLAEHVPTASFEIFKGFNPERDLEPHLCLQLAFPKNFDKIEQVVQILLGQLEGKVPPPGYLDVLVAFLPEENL